MPDLNSKQAKIYREIWAMPHSKKLIFNDVAKLLVALGCEQSRGNGANVLFRLDGHIWGMHPPHPNPYIKRPYIKQLRAFLTATGNENLLT
jgi:HicA toxin of bacterial toxin-antitoxin,